MILDPKVERTQTQYLDNRTDMADAPYQRIFLVHQRTSHLDDWKETVWTGGIDAS